MSDIAGLVGHQVEVRLTNADRLKGNLESVGNEFIVVDVDNAGKYWVLLANVILIKRRTRDY